MRGVRTDYLIIGGGIIGLSVAKELSQRYPRRSVTVVEKEGEVALHGSGRNSGVLHSGFYYAGDSLKARFTREGNRSLKKYCRERGIRINECGKVVVASDESGLRTLYELKGRGERNGIDVRLVDEKELQDIEPNARTYEKALWSPTTATVDPVEVTRSVQKDLSRRGVRFFFNTPYRKRLASNAVLAGEKTFEAGKIINAAGLYADRIARDFGFSKRYVIIPFKGVYLEYSGQARQLRTNVYPAPDLKTPFLGVHFTVSADGRVKIGPTAKPAFWRENYRGFENFKLGEAARILYREAVLFLLDSFGFRRMAFEEVRKFRRGYLVSAAGRLVRRIDASGFKRWGRPGIRAQLLDVCTRELVQDFVVEGDAVSTHILNAVSPAFTCSIPFGRWVVGSHVEPTQNRVKEGCRESSTQ